MPQKLAKNPSAAANGKVCTFFLQGRCKFGSQCQHIHESTLDGRTSESPNARKPNDNQTNVSLAVTEQLSKTPSVLTSSKRKPRQRPPETGHSLDGQSSGADPSRRLTNSKSTHFTEKRSLNSPNPVNSTSSTDHTKRADIKKSGAPCHAWKVGGCTKGDKCRFVHDPLVQGAENRLKKIIAAQRNREAQQKIQAVRLSQVIEQRERQEAERVQRDAALQAELARQEEARQAHEAQMAAREAARQAKLAEEEAARKARQAQQEARRAEIEKEEAAKTVQHIVLGSTITFGAGLAVQKTLTGFESCHIRIKNLPLDAKQNEICELLTRQGIDPQAFYIVWMKRTAQGKQEANIVSDAEIGKVIAIGLDGIDFRTEKLVFEMSENDSFDGMGASPRWNSNVLTISWRAPSVRFVAEYQDVPQAQAKARELNGKKCAGRRVKVEMNTAPPGRVMLHFCPNSVIISGLPLSVTHADVTVFSGSSLLRRLKSTEYDLNSALRLLRLRIESSPDSGLKTFETISTEAVDDMVKVQASFDSWDQAKRAYDSLVGQRFPYIANSTLRLWLPDPHHYSITIPAEQFLAQKTQWDSLRESIKDNNACDLRITVQDRVSIRVLGKDKKAVGSLKVRVENLAAGEKLENWHRSLGSGSRFLGSVCKSTGAFIRCDWRLQALKVYGDQAAIQKVRAMVESEIERLASLDWTVFLKRRSIRFFIRHGVSALKETLGEDNVTLDLSSSPCKVTVRGGEEARHLLARLIEESLQDSNVSHDTGGQSKCPICYDQVSSAVHLACGHIYCTVCIRHFLVTAADTKIIPLTCMGDEAKCGVPIPIPTIQKFITPRQFDHLLEVVFVSHVEKHPEEFKYCPTPDCSQIYRCNSSASSVVQCPSCFLAMCSSCHEEAHEGMSCAERKLHNDPAEQERLNEDWARQQGIRRCPSCNVWIEKLEGCNHMTCKCGAHICWTCMGTFAQGNIYDHMRTVHGSIHGAAADDQNELLLPQQFFFPAEAFGDYHRQQELNEANRREAQLREENAQRRRQQALALREAERVREEERRRIWQMDVARRREEVFQRQEQEQERPGRCIIM